MLLAMYSLLGFYSVDDKTFEQFIPEVWAIVVVSGIIVPKSSIVSVNLGIHVRTSRGKLLGGLLLVLFPQRGKEIEEVFIPGNVFFVCCGSEYRLVEVKKRDVQTEMEKVRHTDDHFLPQQFQLVRRQLLLHGLKKEVIPHNPHFSHGLWVVS